ncbi:FG-GAP-like repeat-containing protein [Streptomyces griseorubiginosus]|uniref:FG-GAP-like repeat-containing protein n=1 Tax=Streptomyces griseorubiginosus TaxID=67304 RepID=UPI0036785F34
MIHSSLPRRLRRRSPALVAATAVAAALLVPVAAARADTAPTTTTAAVQQAEDTAAAQASETGHPVPVDSATTPTSTLTAQPDGTFTQEISSEPERVQHDGSWVPLDATLRLNGDGGYSPAASTTGLTLSAGGTAPLATLDNGGRQLSVFWPTALPAPTVTGDSALYTNVLPDIDLKVTADDQGGFAEVLVVKTAAAAANPALAHLALTTTGTGVTVAADHAGNLTATDTTTGAEVFHAPAPLMWDSSPGTGTTSATDSATATATKTVKSAAFTTDAQTSGIRATAADAGPKTDDLSNGPAPGSRQAQVAVAVDGDGQVQLTPDQSLLTGANPAHFPVYIDPTWVSVTKDSAAYTYVQSAYPDTSRYNAAGTDPGAGDQDWTSPTGKERTYYQFSIGTTMGDKHIHQALLNVTQTYSADWSCTKYTVTELNVAHIGTSTTWNNQPGTYTQTDSRAFTGSNNDGCAGDTKQAFDVTGSVAADGDGTVTYRLTGSETNRDAFKRFAKKATLTIDYNTAPNTPTATTSSPMPLNSDGTTNYGCTSSTYGWIGKNNGVTLSGHVSDPDGDKQNIRGQFAFWDKGGDGTATASNLISTGDSDGDSASVSGSGGTVHITVSPTTHPLKDGHLYGWHVRADDTIDQSAETDNCYFWYDATAPTGPTITSEDFPADGSGTAHAGDAGTFLFSSTDPVPTGAKASGLDHYDWSTSSAADLADDGGTHATGWIGIVHYTPTAWGTNTLWVAAVDKAGNESQPVAYHFYVPENPTGSVHPGDVDNDGRPDLLAGDSASGNLALIHTDQETHATPATAADAAAAPTAADGTSTWADTLIAHRSSSTHSTTGAWVDDLWAYKNGHLWLYSNNINNDGGLAGNGNRYYTKNNRIAITRPACVTGDCTGYTSDWSAVTQLIAPGDVDGDGDPDLLTVENSKLWLFLGSNAGKVTEARKLGDSGWSGYTVLAPGDINADGHADLWTRKNDTGEIYQYPISVGTTIALGARTQITTGAFTQTSRPLAASPGDQNGDGLPDLYTVIVSGSDRSLWANMGQSPDSNGYTLGAHNVVSTNTFWNTVTDIA